MLEAGTLVAWNSEISHGRFRRLKWKTLEPRSPPTRADHSCHHEAPPPSDAKLQISFVTGFIQEPEGLSMKAFMVLWTWKAGREPGGQCRSRKERGLQEGEGSQSRGGQPRPVHSPRSRSQTHSPLRLPPPGPGPGLSTAAASSLGLCSGSPQARPTRCRRGGGGNSAQPRGHSLSPCFRPRPVGALYTDNPTEPTPQTDL